MNPILVTGPGRSGTTMLMAILAQLPGVCVADLVPYETKLISYYATAYRTLTESADHARSMHPDKLGKDEFSVGFNPFANAVYSSVFQDKSSITDYFTNLVPTELRKTFAKLIIEYYSRLAADQGKVKSTYFAEKSNDVAPLPRAFVRLAFKGAKEILLFRDPRDLYCSRKAFFRYDPERAMAEVTHTCRTLTHMIDHGEADFLALSYERLVLQRADSLRMLSVFLGIPVTAPDATAQQSLFRGHGTSETPQASIGRWKTDMTPQEKSAGQAAWREFLVRFEYDRDDAATAGDA